MTDSDVIEIVSLRSAIEMIEFEMALHHARIDPFRLARDSTAYLLNLDNVSLDNE